MQAANAAARTPQYPRATAWLVVALAIAVAGFVPSFFARFGSAGWATHLHGLSAFGWMLLLVVQAQLVRRRQLVVHRALGRWSWLLVLGFVVGGVLMLDGMLAGANPFPKAFGTLLAFIDITTLAFFVTAYVLAVNYRHDRHRHSRWMLATVVPVLPPALARLLPGVVPAIDSFPEALHASQIGAELVALALVIDDLRRGKLYAAYPSVLALLVLQHVLMGPVNQTAAWQAFCAWLAQLL